MSKLPPRLLRENRSRGSCLGNWNVSWIGFFYFSGDVSVISAGNTVLFPLADPVAKRIRLADVFPRQSIFANIGIPDAQGRIGRGKVRIQSDRAPQCRMASSSSFLVATLYAFSASSEDVVASMGVSYLWSVLSDSPNFFLRFP